MRTATSTPSPVTASGPWVAPSSLAAMEPFPQPSLLRALARGSVGRCPRCGSGHLFRYWVSMVDDCPRCGMHFERSQGYWLGSMLINLAVTMGIWLVTFVGLMVATWPDVPWGWVMAVVVAVTVVVPVAFHPIARTIWVALERHVRARSEPYA